MSLVFYSFSSEYFDIERFGNINLIVGGHDKGKSRLLFELREKFKLRGGPHVSSEGIRTCQEFLSSVHPGLVPLRGRCNMGLSSLPCLSNYLTNMYVALAQTRDRAAVFFDDFCHNVHPYMIPRIIDFIVDVVDKTGIQVFIASHSYDVVRSFGELTRHHENLESLVLRLFKNPENPKTRAVIYDEIDIRNSLIMGIDIR